MTERVRSVLNGNIILRCDVPEGLLAVPGLFEPVADEPTATDAAPSALSLQDGEPAGLPIDDMVERAIVDLTELPPRRAPGRPKNK